MATKETIILSILILFISSARAQELSQLVETGQPKVEIEEAIGSPDEIKIYAKQNEHIWGPEEAFWSEIPKGTTLEVWMYKSKSGQLNLYFMNNCSNLSYKAFAPEGVVYESDR